MEKFNCRTEILAGRGILSALKRYESRRVLLVTDPYFMKNGMAGQVIRATGAAEHSIFDAVAPDPSVELAARGAAQAKAFGPDLMVALGGGSAMDCAKAIGYFSSVGCPLVAIPTTSGSGSEVTDFAILTHNGVKHPLVDEKLRPAMALLDEDFLQELPRGLIADTGFDVLAHALEACAATNGGSFTDCLARDAFRMAFSALPRSFAGEKACRLPMHKASAMAGLAFTQAGLGLCHALSHALGGAFHVPHGRLNAILLPVVLHYNSPTVPGKYAALARAAGFSAASDTMAIRSLKNGLIRLRQELGLPRTLAEAGIAPAALRQAEEKILEASLADPCAQTNPAPVDAELVRSVLREVSGHGG